MPSHYKKSDNKKPMKKNKPVRQSPRELKKEEKDLLKIHSKSFSKEHIEEMKKFMKSGKGCYSESHKHALKKYPK